MSKAMKSVIKRVRFPFDIMLTCVRWYLAYALSLRNLEEMMQERGVYLDHSTIHRWVIKLTPMLEKEFRKRKRKRGIGAVGKYWLSTLPESTTIEELVRSVQMRWRIEHDFLELKDELGLNQFEGRNWGGFHHHASMCIAAFGFLLAERGRFSASGGLAFTIHTFSKGRKARASLDHLSAT